MIEDIRIILADDSPTVRRYLANLIDEVPGMRVIGEARNGAEAVQLVAQLKPDVVSMDIKMPGINGLEATRRIMSETPTPVVVVSGMLDTDVQLSLEALEAGALAVVGKPPDRKNPTFPDKHRQLITTLRAMSGVKVVSRRTYPNLNGETRDITETQEAVAVRPMPEIIAIGASTGGPSALHRLLRELPADLSLPVVIAQHMPDEFMPGLANWLNTATPLDVVIVQHGMELVAGRIVLASGAANLKIIRKERRLIAQLSHETGGSHYHPSVDVLLQSIAETCGDAAIGLILTGMGSDGAKGLLAMKQAGAVTIAQDEASSTVFGMPRAAIEADAATHIETLLNIPSKILKLL